jgi:hypothetical protein
MRNDEESAGTGIGGEQVDVVGEGSRIHISAVLSFEKALLLTDDVVFRFFCRLLN